MNEHKPQILIKQLFKLCDNGQITSKALFEHCDTIISAASETTSFALANTILLLAMHPEIQEKVYKELRQVFPEQESDVSYDDITNLTYLEMVIKESMRIIPVIPLILRETTSDIKLSDNFPVKKGKTIIIILSNVHTNPEIWGPNANKFDPDHFLPERIATRHPFSYVPFGCLPRNCIGN